MSSSSLIFSYAIFNIALIPSRISFISNIVLLISRSLTWVTFISSRTHLMFWTSVLLIIIISMSSCANFNTCVNSQLVVLDWFFFLFVIDCIFLHLCMSSNLCVPKTIHFTLLGAGFVHSFKCSSSLFWDTVNSFGAVWPSNACFWAFWRQNQSTLSSRDDFSPVQRQYPSEYSCFIPSVLWNLSTLAMETQTDLW